MDIDLKNLNKHRLKRPIACGNTSLASGHIFTYLERKISHIISKTIFLNNITKRNIIYRSHEGKRTSTISFYLCFLLNFDGVVSVRIYVPI